MKACNGRLWGTIANDQVEIRSVTLEKLDVSLDVLDNSFFLNENVSRASEVNLPENKQARQELRELCRITAEDGVSLLALEKSTGKPIAVAFNKIQYIPDNGEDIFFVKFRKEKTHSPQAQSLMDFMITVNDGCDIFKKFNLDYTCELMFLATLPEWERNGIGRALVQYTVELTRELKNDGEAVQDMHPSLQTCRPLAVNAIWSSFYSQKIGKSLGFQVLNRIPYERFSYAGKSYDQRLSPPHVACEQVIYLL